MLKQFEKEKEKSTIEEVGNTSMSSTSRDENSFLYDSLVELLAERKSLRMELSKLHKDFYSVYSTRPPQVNVAEKNELTQVRIKQIAVEMTYLQEDISSVIAAAGTDIDKKLTNSNDNNKEVNKLSSRK